MNYSGQIISLIVAVSWTFAAIFAEIASKRLTPIILNVMRMILSLILLSLILFAFTGQFYPCYTDTTTWFWFLLSGVVGYIFGDTCLFNSYVVIGSRFGQLFMTLSPPTAAIISYFMIGEKMSAQSIIGMIVTLSGIGISIMNKGEHNKMKFKLPLKGILLGIGAGVGQGSGLALSKMGISHYTSIIPENASLVNNLLPFSATFIRSIAGLIGFAIILRLSKERHFLPTALKDKKGLWNGVAMTFFGPFLGVSLSLLALQYTSTGIASTLMAISPILIILPSKYIFKQKVTVKEVIGAFISVLGVSLFFI